MRTGGYFEMRIGGYFELRLAGYLDANIQPLELMDGPAALVKLYPTEGLALTEVGWSAFVSWMTETLNNAQYEAGFAQKVQRSAKNSVE